MARYVRIFLGTGALFGAFVLCLAGLFAGAYYYAEPSLPRAEELRDVRLQVPLRVYSRDGRLIGQFGEQRRNPVPYAQIPQLLVRAVLAAEDDRFFEHPGFDYQGILRAALNVVETGGGRSQGGSTITQQLARMSFLSRERTYVRKFKEAILAVRIEREFTKEEILELFLNTMFFGQQSYGVAAAAQTYFNKRLDELTVSEAAIIAGILQGPSILNPVASPTAAASRRAYVLRRMRELNVIDAAQYQTALAEPIESQRYGPQVQVPAPYVAEMVRADLVRRLGPAAYTAGIKVKTTIDSRLQRAANAAVRDELMDYDERHGYRGPVARLDAAALEPAEGQTPEEHWLELLADYPAVTDLKTGLVVGVDEESAEVFFADQGRVPVSLEAVAWAAPYISDSRVGDAPSKVGDVLRVGDVVRFRKTEDDSLRLSQIPDVQGALVALDPQDGAVTALVGGFDFFLSNFNRATQSRRQPGSSFKPFVYSAALEHGFTPATVVNDAPIVLKDEQLEIPWRPENDSGTFRGDTPLREALVHSMNLVSVRVILKVGPGTTVRYLRKFGFADDALPANPSLALGAGGIAPIDLAGGFAVFANGGSRVPPYYIERIEDLGGEVLYQASPQLACTDCDDKTQEPDTALVDDITELYPMRLNAPRAITRRNAYLITDMMRDVIRRGTGRRALALGRHDLAGKTGTSNEHRDTWFSGFNADLVATTWVGFDQDRPLGDREEGARTALPVWNAFMAKALAGVPEHMLPRPPGIIDVRIDPKTGLRARNTGPSTVFEKFDVDHLPDWQNSTPLASAPVVESGPEPDEEPQPIF